MIMEMLILSRNTPVVNCKKLAFISKNTLGKNTVEGIKVILREILNTVLCPFLSRDRRVTKV